MSGCQRKSAKRSSRWPRQGFQYAGRGNFRESHKATFSHSVPLPFFNKIYSSHQIMIAICKWMVIECMQDQGVNISEKPKSIFDILMKNSRLSGKVGWMYDLCYSKELESAVQTFDKAHQYWKDNSMSKALEDIHKKSYWTVLSDNPLRIQYDINSRGDDEDQKMMLRVLKKSRRSNKQMATFRYKKCGGLQKKCCNQNTVSMNTSHKRKSTACQRHSAANKRYFAKRALKQHIERAHGDAVICTDHCMQKFASKANSPETSVRRTFASCMRVKGNTQRSHVQIAENALKWEEYQLQAASTTTKFFCDPHTAMTSQWQIKESRRW